MLKPFQLLKDYTAYAAKLSSQVPKSVMKLLKLNINSLDGLTQNKSWYNMFLSYICRLSLYAEFSCDFELSFLSLVVFLSFLSGSCYRIGKKKSCLRSQIYIKLKLSNGDDSRKHPLKYFCLKCHILWEISKTNFPFWVSLSERFIKK